MTEPCFDVFERSQQAPVTGVKRTIDEMNATDEDGNLRTVVIPDEPDGKRSKTGAFGVYQEQDYEVVTTEGCVHERVFPPRYDRSSHTVKEPPVEPAKKYPFVLDRFQQISVDCLENNESVLVAAHTSAGKTVVAEYAIAMSLRDGQRVIYTSPIKALSNQKYRELNEEFGDVGLMTGDVTINPSASCLVMTTEILRNMLYRGSEVMREVQWVIFDEIHYMRDKERGVVWEESMILLHHKVRFVFLSATIPNAREFSMWIAKLHNQPCNVVYTDHRPTPLQHYVFPAGGEGLHLVVDDRGEFKEDNFQKALAGMNQDSSAPGARAKKGGSALKKGGSGTQGPSDIFKLVRMILDRRYDPVIIFSFSKRECEAYALQMSKLDFTNDDEKKLIQEIFQNAIESLSGEDQNLPQVVNIIPLLRRGIGIHHGGLLPIVKEVIEILFQESLLKVLFSTETFSMGLNMPAKTVVFTAVRKFDGTDFRLVSPGEYVQMSGRAGRRGLDARGLVILMMEEKLEPHSAKQILLGHADPLYSSFHLGYNMLLNLLLVEEADPEYVIERSFHQFQAGRAAPAIASRLREMEASRDELASKLKDESAMVEYHHLRTRVDALTAKMLQVRNDPSHILPFLNAGRLVTVMHPDHGTAFGWCALVNFTKKSPPKRSGSLTSAPVFLVDVLVKCERIPEEDGKGNIVPWTGTDERSSARVIQLPMSAVERVSSLRISLPKQLTARDAGLPVIRSIDEVVRRFPKGIPELDPVEDMKITEKGFAKLLRQIESAETDLAAHPYHDSAVKDDPDMRAQWDAFIKKRAADKDISILKKEVENLSKTSLFASNFKAMKRVLRRLGFITKENVVDTKGRVACCISTADELLATELIFSGVFNELSTEHVVALVSCLVYTEKGDENLHLEEPLAAPLRTLRDHAKRIAEVSNESKLQLDTTEYVSSFKPDLMPLVQAWCRGAKFADVCKMAPSIFEGSIIRCMRRLEELLRQLSSAAKLIGNADLETKFDQGIALIKRDIVFAASLYL
ncbi:Helicase ATP-binding domain-containing protein [Plasmodiophora brassicae]